MEQHFHTGDHVHVVVGVDRGRVGFITTITGEITTITEDLPLPLSATGAELVEVFFSLLSTSNIH